MKIARVFPRRTNATPADALAFIGGPDLFSGTIEVDKVHISVTFTWDLPEGERLYKQWSRIAPAEIGGPALGLPGENFIPGMYLKTGYVITSRGCPNRCWFCSVWRREGDTLRELPVTDGYIIQDDNLLSCSETHIREVFAMLARQKERPVFSGGLEAKKLQPWHAEELLKLKPKQMFFAYDTPDDRDPLFEAGKLLLENGFSRQSHNLRAYVLIGYPGDTFEKAEKRLTETMQAGFLPFAMLYRDQSGNRDPDWIRFSWPWSRPAAISAKYRSIK
ncbi:MAG: hypothetical protein LBR99_01315 [Treponema sp.]|jgi:hypothetical protein|nr:hypothetical protein [Treponema sp.]